MKKFAAILFLCSLTASAFAGELYAGIAAGSTNLNTSSFGGLIGTKLNSTALQNFGGSLNIEGYYTSLGSWSFTTNFGGGTTTDTFSYSSLGVDLVGLVPIRSMPHLSVFGKLGFSHTSHSYSCSFTGNAGFFCFPPYTLAANGLEYGFGGQYELDKSIGLRLGYQTYAGGLDTFYAAALFSF